MIQEAIEKVKSGESEVILDFSSVRRIDTNMVGALEELARLADGKSVKLCCAPSIPMFTGCSSS